MSFSDKFVSFSFYFFELIVGQLVFLKDSFELFFKELVLVAEGAVDAEQLCVLEFELGVLFVSFLVFVCEGGEFFYLLVFMVHALLYGENDFSLFLKVGDLLLVLLDLP